MTYPNAKLTLTFESGRVEAGIGRDGRWWFSFFTDADGSYMSADVSEDTLRSLLAWAESERKAASQSPAP